jgi:hypothetical protein
MDKKVGGIPFVRGLKIKHISFFSHPLIPEFLRVYGPQIQTVTRPDCFADVVPEEVAFYMALPNLRELSTRWLGENVPNVKMPALERLHLFSVNYDDDEGPGNTKFDFLLNFPNLRQLWLPFNDEWFESVGVLSALGSYFAVRNGWEELSPRRTLIISVDPHFIYDLPKLNPTEEMTRLLQELAVTDGRILIEKLPVTLLDEAVGLFRKQRGGKLLLRSFGKCIRSLVGFSGSVYEVELPNMRKLEVCWALEGTKAREGDYSRTVIWPKLEVELDVGGEKDVSYLPKLVFGSGVVRLSVKRLFCNLKLLSLGSKEAHLGLANFPNLARLELKFGVADVRLFRSLMRVLPASCPKIQLLELLHANYTLREEDFLGMDEEGLDDITPPVLQFPGK